MRHLSQLQCSNIFSQVLKGCRKKKAKGKKKSVAKSLYGERDIASKKPLLSPIPELPEVSEMTPSVPGVPRMCSGSLSFSCRGCYIFSPPTLLPFHSSFPLSHSLYKEYINLKTAPFFSY